MKNILDTHVVMWLATNAPQLSETAKQAIFNSASENYVSIVSAWEVSIKMSLGKLRLKGGVSEFFEIIYENGFELLPLKEEYIKQVETLPLLHRDPFDRMLIVSAMSEGMSLITADTNIHQYKIPWIW
jgi:PIN domain nuclease of toxin-antitoxin system